MNDFNYVDVVHTLEQDRETIRKLRGVLEQERETIRKLRDTISALREGAEEPEEGQLPQGECPVRGAYPVSDERLGMILANTRGENSTLRDFAVALDEARKTISQMVAAREVQAAEHSEEIEEYEREVVNFRNANSALNDQILGYMRADARCASAAVSIHVQPGATVNVMEGNVELSGPEGAPWSKPGEDSGLEEFAQDPTPHTVYWDDVKALEDALLVWRHQPDVLDRIENWLLNAKSAAEGDHDSDNDREGASDTTAAS